MNCESAADGLSALLDGALAPPERASLEAHLAACAPCRARCAELAEVRLLLRSLEDADAVAPAGVRERVMAALAAPPARPRSVLPLVLVGTLLGVLVAAPVALRIVKRSPPAAKSVAAAAPETPAKAEIPAPAPVWTPPPLPEPEPIPPKPDPEPPAVVPDPAIAVETTHLEAVLDDPDALAALQALLAQYPGKVDTKPLDAGAGLHGLAADLEGVVSEKTADFAKKLQSFQREHRGHVRRWKTRTETN